jgi:hypothetical protein
LILPVALGVAAIFWLMLAARMLKPKPHQQD